MQSSPKLELQVSRLLKHAAFWQIDYILIWDIPCRDSEYVA